MAANRKLVLTIIGNAKGAVQALGATEAGAKKLQSTLLTASKYLSVGFAAIGAAGAYMGKQVFDGAMMAVKGAAEDQKSVQLLEKQIRQATNATDEQIRANEDYIKTLQYSAAVADSELRPALANLVRGTGNLTDAQSLLKLSLDISAATGKDLATVTMAMGRAATGNVGALTRMGIPLDENTKKSKNFNAVVDQLTKTFGGASAAAVDTFDGRMRQLKIGLDEAMESIGYALLPYAERLVKFINTSIVPALQIFADNLTSKGVAGAAQLAVASMGELGTKGVNGIESVVMATLVATRKIVDMAEKVLFIATVMNMLSGNAAAFAKTWTAGFSADRIKAGIDDAMRTLPGMFDDFRNGVDRASVSLERQAEEAQELARRGIKQKEVTKDNINLQQQYGGAVSGAAKQIDKAKQATSEYTRQLTSAQSAVKSAAAASKDLKRADEEVASSLRSLEAARRQFTQVITGYGADSKQAADKQRVLAKAQRDLERSGYAVEQAVFAVADAEAELAAVRADPVATADDIREAEIKLAEARLAIADATDSQYQATLDLTEAQRQLDVTTNGAKEGSQEYAEVLTALEEAQRSYQSAIESQVTAREREAEAIKKVREEEELLAKLRDALPKGTVLDAGGNIVEQPKTGAAFPNFMAAVRALHPNAPALQSKTPVKAARMAFPKLYKEYKEAGLALADGGIVRRPTTALIGEAGPEAVIPLRDIASMGSTNVYVTVNAGLGADAAVIGDEIVNILQRYNRRNGALPLKVA